MLETIELYFFLFISYSFCGWCMEVVCKWIQYKRFINRGFLIGPYCPIYGFGALAITLLLQKYSNDPIVLFILGIVICSILEYTTSYLMEKLWKARWWDYSTKKYNINGRICLETMIPFGLLGLLMIYITNPLLIHLFQAFPPTIRIILTSILFIIYFIDNILSFLILITVRKNRPLLVHDSTEEISKTVMQSLKTHSIFLRRLMNAFPNMKWIGIKMDQTKKQLKKYLQKQEKIRKKTEMKLKRLEEHYHSKTEKVKHKMVVKIKKIEWNKRHFRG